MTIFLKTFFLFFFLNKFLTYLQAKTDFTNDQTCSIKDKCLPNEAVSCNMRMNYFVQDICAKQTVLIDVHFPIHFVGYDISFFC